MEIIELLSVLMSYRIVDDAMFFFPGIDPDVFGSYLFISLGVSVALAFLKVPMAKGDCKNFNLRTNSFTKFRNITACPELTHEYRGRVYEPTI